jgi:hypothetical protein
MRQLKKYTVFMDSDRKCLWGVTGISDPVDASLPYMPIMAKTVLLPFKGRIIYDGFFNTYAVHFGSGTRAGFNEEYMTLKKAKGIRTTIDIWDGDQARHLSS